MGNICLLTDEQEILIGLQHPKKYRDMSIKDAHQVIPSASTGHTSV